MRFRTVSGPDLTTRNDAYLAWQRDREQADLWPYFRRYDTALTARAIAVSDTGVVTHGPNFGGQDYLSLTGHPAVLDAAHQALRDYGPITAGSPALAAPTRSAGRWRQGSPKPCTPTTWRCSRPAGRPTSAPSAR